MLERVEHCMVIRLESVRQHKRGFALHELSSPLLAISQRSNEARGFVCCDAVMSPWGQGRARPARHGAVPRAAMPRKRTVISLRLDPRGLARAVYRIILILVIYVHAHRRRGPRPR